MPRAHAASGAATLLVRIDDQRPRILTRPKVVLTWTDGTTLTLDARDDGNGADKYKSDHLWVAEGAVPRTGEIWLRVMDYPILREPVVTQEQRANLRVGKNLVSVLDPSRLAVRQSSGSSSSPFPQGPGGGEPPRGALPLDDEADESSELADVSTTASQNVALATIAAVLLGTLFSFARARFWPSTRLDLPLHADRPLRG